MTATGTRPTPWDRAPILNSPIPQGHYGRALTSAECRALRDLGRSCSDSWVVVRQVADVDNLGILYKPAPGGGYNNTKIYVTTK